MILETFDTLIKDAFARQDHSRLTHLFAMREEDPQTDLEKTLRAYESLARGESTEAEGYLAALTNDGSISPVDVAFVRAFAKELEGEPAEVVAILEPHVDDQSGIQSGRVRLSLADSLLRAGRYDRIEEALKGYIEPPGVPQTLEAHLILLEAMLRTGAEQDQLVEQCSLIDILLERGFRLAHSGNVVYYASLLNAALIDGIVENLLNTHQAVLDRHTPSEREEIIALLEWGEKYKAPGAVRAAARGYISDPFPLETMQADAAAYLFASHEEHEAARQALLTGFPPKRIFSDQELWGPLLLSTYNAGRWEETLALLEKQKDSISGNKIAGHANAMRIVSLFQLGRYAEAVDGLGKSSRCDFLLNMSGNEAAALALSHAALGNFETMVSAFREALESHPAETEWLGDYATAVTFELTFYRREEALTRWLAILPEFIPPGNRIAMLYRTGDMMIEWCLPAHAELCAQYLTKHHAPEGAHILRISAASNSGDRAATEAAIAALRAAPGPITEAERALFEGRAHLRLGDLDQALALLSPLAVNDQFPRQTAAAALLINAVGRRGEEGEARNAFTDLRSKIGRSNIPEGEKGMVLYESRQLATGEHPEGYLELAEEVYENEPASVEVLRLARRAALAFDASEEVREDATELLEDWWAENVKRA